MDKMICKYRENESLKELFIESSISSNFQSHTRTCSNAYPLTTLPLSMVIVPLPALAPSVERLKQKPKETDILICEINQFRYHFI